MRAMSERELDLVLFGATGYTGQLCASYLAASADPPRWAIAGRHADKLAAVRAAVAARHPAASDLEIITADLDDLPSLQRMVARTRAIATTVGPYSHRGGALVAACVDAGTHYADLTGEVPWMRHMIDAHHEAARARHVRIVHACGFDSIPSDLGVLLLQTTAREQLGRPCDKVTSYVELKGGFSGGTVASAMAIAEQVATDPRARRLLLDPYALVPDPDLRGPDRGEQRGVGYAPLLDRPTGPFVMATINARVVRRSHALLRRPWGEGFRYDECMTLPRGARGKAIGAAIATGVPLFLGAMAVPAVRNFLGPRLMQSGEGPSPESRAAGHFVVRLVGEIDGKPAFYARVADRRDPGYTATAAMLCESGRSLAEDPLVSPGGVLTPAVAMGHHLIERLRDAGMTLEAGADRALIA